MQQDRCWSARASTWLPACVDDRLRKVMEQVLDRIHAAEVVDVDELRLFVDSMDRWSFWRFVRLIEVLDDVRGELVGERWRRATNIEHLGHRRRDAAAGDHIDGGDDDDQPPDRESPEQCDCVHSCPPPGS
ncbi:MAG: hypothetical protein KY460_11995 [Actinobacteria bacterium]|nr:hypothetical protein [Actinomycetota bacterium]